MSDYHKIQSTFWLSGTGKKLRGDTCAQLVAVYLMSSPHANMIGVYHCPPLYVAHETGTCLDAVEQAIRILSDVGYCTFDPETEYVFVHRMAAYQIGESLSAKDNRVTSVRKAIESLPDFSIKQMFIRRYAEVYHLQDLIDDSVVMSPNNVGGAIMDEDGQEDTRRSDSSNGHPEGEKSCSGTPSRHLRSPSEAPQKPLASPLQAPSKVIESPFGDPFEDLGGPFEGYIFDLSAPSDDLGSPFGAPFEDLASPLQAPIEDLRSPFEGPTEPLASPFEASSSNSSSSSSSNTSVPAAPIKRSADENENKDSPGVRKRTTGEAVTTKTWEAYSQAYQRRYGTEPVRNRTVNGQMAHFVQRLGQEEAPAVAAFFVKHNGRLYAQGMHPVGLLLSHAESLRTEWFNSQRPRLAAVPSVTGGGRGGNVESPSASRPAVVRL